MSSHNKVTIRKKSSSKIECIWIISKTKSINNLLDLFRIDTLYEGTRDFYAMFLPYGFAGYKETLDKVQQKGFPRYLPVYNKVIIK